MCSIGRLRAKWSNRSSNPGDIAHAGRRLSRPPCPQVDAGMGSDLGQRVPRPLRRCRRRAYVSIAPPTISSTSYPPTATLRGDLTAPLTGPSLCLSGSHGKKCCRPRTRGRSTCTSRPRRPKRPTSVSPTPRPLRAPGQPHRGRSDLHPAGHPAPSPCSRVGHACGIISAC